MKITAESLIWNSARKKVLLNHKYEIVRYIHLSDTKEIKTFPTEKWKKHPTPELGLERTIRLLQRHMYPMGIQQTFSCQDTEPGPALSRTEIRRHASLHMSPCAIRPEFEFNIAKKSEKNHTCSQHILR